MLSINHRCKEQCGDQLLQTVKFKILHANANNLYLFTKYVNYLHNSYVMV